MAVRPRITRHQYETLCASLLADQNLRKAARLADVSWRIAKKAWETGWDKPGIDEEGEWDAPAIRLQSEDAYQIAREQRQKQKLAEEEYAKRKAEEVSHKMKLVTVDAAEQRAKEAEAVELVLNNALSGLQVTTKLHTAETAIVDALVKGLLDRLRRRRLTEEEQMGVLQRISDLRTRYGKMVTDSMEQWRKYLGEPEKIVGVQNNGPKEVPGDRIVAVLGEEGVKRALAALAAGEVNEEVQKLIALRAEES